MRASRLFTPSITVVLILSLATVLGAWVCFSYFADKFESDTTQNYEEKQYEHVQSIARNATNTLSLIERDMEYIANLPPIQSGDPVNALTELHLFYTRFQNEITDISLIDSTGHTIATHLTGTERLGLSSLHRPSTRKTIETQKSALAGPFKALSGRMAVSLDVPVFQTSDNKKVFVGTLSCLIEIPKWLKLYVTPFDLHLGSSTWLLNEEGQIVAHANTALIGSRWEMIEHGSSLDSTPQTPDRSADSAFLKQARGNGSGSQQIVLKSLGEEVQLVAYSCIQVAGARWLVISNAPRQAVLRSFRENMRSFWSVALIFLVLLVSVTILALYSERAKLKLSHDLQVSLQQSEKKYRMLIESSNDGIVLTSPDGLIKLVNRRFAEMLGSSEERLLGTHILELFPEEQRARLNEQFSSREAGSSSIFELTFKPKDKGHSVTALVSGSPVYNRRNEHLGNLEIFTDISDKKRAEEQLRRRYEEMSAINAIAETANRSLIIEEILENATIKLRDLLQFDGCLLAYHPEESARISIAASHGFSAKALSHPALANLQRDRGFFGKTFTAAEPLVFETIPDSEEARPFLDDGFKSIAFIPIQTGVYCCAVICCGSRSPREFSRPTLELLQTIAQTIGISIEKARLFQAEKWRAIRLETIYQVGEHTTSLLPIDELLPKVTKLIKKTFNYYNVNILLKEGDKDELVFRSGYGGFPGSPPIGLRVQPTKGIVGRSFRLGEPVMVNDVTRDPDYIELEGLSETRSELAVPLLRRGEPIGVLDVESRQVNAFNNEDMITLQVLAEQVAVAVENARLYERLKQSLEEARRSQAFFSKIVLESPLSTIVTDAQGVCILLNSSACELLGSELRDLAGRYNLITDPPFHNTEAANQIQQALTGRVVQFNLDLEGKQLRATVFPLTEAGSVANIVAMFEDLTEKRRLEEALRQAQKMESIGTLAGGIAHDFNNILGGVLGYVSLIKTRISHHDPLWRYVEIIEKSARRAADLTQQLLAFARGGKYSVQILDLNRIVNEAVQLVASTLGKKIEVVMELEEGLPKIEGDSSQIVQALVNICINARDAMPQGGQLRIKTQTADPAKPSRFNLTGRTDGYVLLKVEDTGIGMTKEVMSRIFEPFYTTKREQKGTGLGLAMVYGIVKNHGGYIDVDSEPNSGTCFSIYLPATTRAIEERHTPEGRPAGGGHETILVAEDEEVIRELLTEMLSDEGYQVLVAENGKEALDIYSKEGSGVDLVILDMIMPEVNGVEAFRQMKQLDPQAKILLSSGYTQESEAQSILNEGALGFIQKPYAVNELLSKIRSILDGRP